MFQKALIAPIFLTFALFSLSGCLPVIFTGAAGSAFAFAKDREADETITDVRIATGIKAELFKKDFRGLYTQIKVEVVRGRVLLTGLIDKEEDSIKAVAAAWNQKSVVEVINELKVDKNSKHFNFLQYTRDAMVTSQIKSKIFINRDIKFVNYTVITINDIVYLFGMARSEEELEKVANIASNVYGVHKVITHVQLNSTENNYKSRNSSNDKD